MVSIRKPVRGVIPVIALFVLMAFSLYLNAILIENSQLFAEYRLGLITFAVLLITVFAFLIIKNTVSLLRAYAQKRIGSRLTVRLVGVVVGLMLIPAVTLYVFSTWLVDKGVDSWFDADVEAALNSSLELSRWSLDSRMHSFYDQVQAMAEEISNSPDEVASLALKSFVEQEGGPEELMLLHNNREVIASAVKETVGALMELPSEGVLREVEQSSEAYAGLDPVGDDSLYIRLVFPVSSAEVLGKTRFLYALYPVPQKASILASSVEDSYSKYNRLIFSREALKHSFLLTLTLVLLSGVLYAGWAAFYFARRLSDPIAMLDEGTQAVAAGKLDTRLEVTANDEFGSLVESFNDMTQRLAAAQNSAQINRLQLERQRGYLQAVLEHVSSGVISLNQENILRTVNTAACDILSFDFNPHINQELDTITKDQQPGEFLFYCMAEIAKHGGIWNEQMEYSAADNQHTLLCYGQGLPDGGTIIVVNDITDIVQAQRHRTWSEIARRMAHEFKNPLTPIQLSAERLNKKLSPLLDQENGELLNRGTEIITQQVDAMRRIVDDFSQFAQAVPMDMRDVDINKVVKDVADLYVSGADGVQLECRLDSNLPMMRADAGRLRQLLHNLLSNATDALKGISDPQIFIATRNTDSNAVEMEVRDNGDGFDANIIDKAFQPYVTNRPGGTGLGLAIAKRIAEEHNGGIRIENHQSGASVRVTLQKSHSAHR